MTTLPVAIGDAEAFIAVRIFFAITAGTARSRATP